MTRPIEDACVSPPLSRRLKRLLLRGYDGTTDRASLVAQLRRALRRERARGLAGHWTYDLGRHRALLAAWRQASRELCDDRRRRRCKP